MVELWQQLLVVAEDFRLLRPWWLLVLPVALVIPLLVRYRQRHSDWERFIDPVLLKPLLQQPPRQGGLTPNRLAMVLLLVWGLILSGPSWRLQPSPLVDDQAPLVIALSLHHTMLTEDLKPSRLARAKLKVAQLLAERQGAPTALIAYSGSAHVVLPLTEDEHILSLYLEELQPDVMPQPGLDTQAALRLAGSLLAGQVGRSGSAVGSVLLVTDRVEPHARNPNPEGPSVNLLLLGPSAATAEDLQIAGAEAVVDIPGVTAFCQRESINLVTMTADNGDLVRIQRLVRRAFVSRDLPDAHSQYEDAGYHLLIPFGLLLLIWFRKGMVLQ